MKKLSILWVLIILFGYYYTVCFSCAEEERNGLMKLKPFLGKFASYYGQDHVLTWVDDKNSDCCDWKLVKCDNNTRRVIRLDLQVIYVGRVLNASLFLPFQQLQYLDLSNNFFSDLQNDQDLRSLKKLQVLILNENHFNNASIFQSLSALTSLTALGLSYNAFNGSLADVSRELCKLKKLKELFLRSNMLSGSIPTCFSNLTSLEALDLSNNQLVGNLDPSFFVNLTKLEYLFLSGNQWLEVNLMFNSGSHRELPFKFLGLSKCNLNTSTTDLVKILHNQSNLIWLDLSHNNLHGEFSNLIFENNSRLEILNLKNNSLVGHIHFPVRPHVNLVSLDVSYNHIQGEVQPNIGQVLPKLAKLNFANNDLQGAIPMSLLNMKDLESLDLSNNNLSGKLPERLDLSCKRLGWIRLSNNSLEGQISDTLFNLTDLSVLDLSNNHFTGHIPSTNFQSFELGILDISQNHISGRIPPSLGNSTNFYTLFMNNNFIEGHIPPEICNLPYLISLDLSGNQISGLLPSCLTTMQNLQYLHLQRNKLTSPLLPMTSPLNTTRDFKVIDLRHNKFSGEIPKRFGFILDLRVLLLQGNRFSGSIPHELCRLQKMGIMDLSHNSLSGSIPPCFDNITFGKMDYNNIFSPSMTQSPGTYLHEIKFQGVIVRLLMIYNDDLGEYITQQEDVEFVTKSRSNSYEGEIINIMYGLDLSCNHLEGNIPLDIGALRDLRALNLSHNQFTGVIPPSLSNMKQIESIDLSNNKLSGEIPSSLTRLSTLAVFNVAYNNLSGRVPEMVAQFSTFNETSYEGNPFLCGPPLLEQCKNNTDQVTTTDALAGRNDVFGIDPICFLASFAATYVTCLLGFVIVLCINPYWRRRWFHFIDTCLSFVFPSWYLDQHF